VSGIREIAHEICANLEEQSRVWRRLLDLSHAQLSALQQQDVHAVHAILQEVEIAMLERSRAEVRRSILIDQAGASLGIPPFEVTRDKIVAVCDAPIGAALARAADELRELASQLDAVVTRNAAMLEQELAIIDVMVQGVTVDRTQRVTYGKTGSQTDAPRLRLLDAQV